MIYVTHIKKNKNAVYIGRPNPSHGLAGSPLQNPYKLKPGEDRGATIERYEKHLDYQISIRNNVIIEELYRLADIAKNGDLYLGCWCTPNPCHGDIVRKKIMDILDYDKKMGEKKMNNHKVKINTKHVAIIGSREINDEQFNYLADIASKFVAAGWTVTTGCADGADHAAMVGAREIDPTKLEIFLPWASYNNNYHDKLATYTVFNEKTHKHWLESVDVYHEAPQYLKQGARRLMARNYGIIEHVDLVIAHPMNLSSMGGTGQAIRIARGTGRPCFTVCDEENRNALHEFMVKEAIVAPFNVTITATQAFDNYELLEKKCYSILSSLMSKRDIVIHVKGADNIKSMVKKFADKYYLKVRKTNHTKENALIAFHDDKNKVVQGHIDKATQASKQVRVIRYNEYSPKSTTKSPEASHKEVEGDIFELAPNYDAIAVTTNGILKNDGTLVMGAGVAKSFAKRFPTLPKMMGDYVADVGNSVGLFKVDDFKVFSFPTKHDWRDASDIDLIVKSHGVLLGLMDIFEIKSILLPRPGCSNGGLDWEFVKSHLQVDERITYVSLPSKSSKPSTKGKRSLECSSKGDKRFSAVCVKIEIDGKLRTIEEHYQCSKLFRHKGKVVRFNDAKRVMQVGRYKKDEYQLVGFQINDQSFDLEELSSWYAYLWVQYLDANPKLVKELNKYDEFTDCFRTAATVNCQADVIREYKEDRLALIEKHKVFFTKIKYYLQD